MDDNDLDLGLNLVFDAPTAGVGGRGGANKKRMTKYDKRRERGRLAKLAKEAERGDRDRGGATTTTTGIRDRDADAGSGAASSSSSSSSSSLAGIAVALGGHRAGGKKLESSSADPPERLGDGDVAIEDARAGGGVASNDDKGSAGPSAGEMAAERAPSSSSSSSSSSSASSPSGETARLSRQRRQQQQPTTTTTTTTTTEDRTATSSSSSRRHRAQTSFTDEQRTQYLAEFHARPRDLDRNERASRDIKASRRSYHIFGRGDRGNEDDDDRDEDEDRDDENDDEGGNDVVDGGGDPADENVGEDGCDEEGDELARRIGCPFSKLGLHPRLVSALTSPAGPFKLDRPTIIQSRCVAALLGNGDDDRSGGKKNLFVQSETGSGKTLAYLLPIVQRLASTERPGGAAVDDRKSGGTRCVILCPTRELATQTHAFADRICRSSFPRLVPGCLSGGEKRKSEKARLRRGITVLIATPGRLLDHLTKTESLLLSLRRRGLEWLVLDEADRLLDGGGLGGQVEQIVQRLRGCSSGSDGADTWRSVLVSATVTIELEGTAKRVLGGGDGGWMWARGHDDGTGRGDRGKKVATTIVATTKELVESSDVADDGLSPSSSKRSASNDADDDIGTSHELDNAAPRQLAQLYMIVSAKLRLLSLIAFLAARATKGERTVVFLSTCDSVDYHHALFASMESVLGGDDKDGYDNDDDADGESGKGAGIFGRECPIYKLHGDIPHHKRMSTLQAFSNNRRRSAVLLATDVAARGLNFPSLDWIVQYDPPCETKDYVHRAGRSARAGQAGHALLFLLPSERQYVEVLNLRGLREISPLSLSSTLSAAAALCKGVTREGERGNSFSDGGAEAFTLAMQNRLEECVFQDDVSYRALIEKKFKGDPKQRRRQKKKDAVVGPLLEGARKAFSAFVRAYPAKEKAVRHIFNARALHLGHIARSLALRETPKMVSKGNSHNSNSVDNGEGGTKISHDKAQSGGGKGEKRKSRLAFGNAENDSDAAIDNSEQERYLSLLGNAISGGANRSSGSIRSPSNKKIKQGGLSGKDVQKRMMEAAMLVQSQEYM
ncbi:hypothetical protein ACHAW5_003291 [Stephanodiscus triporus]|uniref:ATP-dependent RNA helicase n=1 Tax=Stephanodiscus triporus TaxID=2934178 RepID=A0ABD3NV36_9STRA